MNSDKDLLGYARQRLVQKTKFLGGPPRDFFKVGKESIETARVCGLLPRHNFLDHGCGVFRCGWWFVRYLHDKRYFGIDADGPRMELGKNTMLHGMHERLGGLAQGKDCKFGMFNERFDFVFSRSVWTHFSRFYVKECLDQFVEHSNPAASYLTSVWPTNGDGATGKQLDIERAEHNLDWIASEAELRGLTFQKLKRPPVNGQVWLLFRIPKND